MDACVDKGENMKVGLLILTTLLLFLVLACGCVTREVKRKPTMSEAATRRTDPSTGLIIEKKTVWFWQD